MTPQQIVNELSKRHKKPPLKALRAALEQRDAVAPLLLDELDQLLARLNEILDTARTEEEFLEMGSKLLREFERKPSPMFYGFLLAAEWKQKEAYRRFAALLSWNWAGAPGLLSELVYENVGAAVMAELYDGDPSPLFNLILDHAAGESIRFWQWRALILLVLRGALDIGAVRKFLVRAFDDLEQEPESHVWSGWEEVIIYFGLEDLVPLVERAHAVQRIQDGTIEEFREKFAYALAHPERPIEDEALHPIEGIKAVIEWAVEVRWP